MADETMTTEVADNPTEQNSESVLGSGSESDNQIETDWKAELSEDLRDNPTLANFKDVESLAKTVVHQQKRLGSTISMPKNDEEKRELYTKLGMPEDPSKYETSVPEDMQQYFDENAMQSFKQVAHDIGLNNEQVNKLIEYQAGQISQQTQMQQAGLSEQKEVVERDLKNEYGLDFTKQMKAAQRAISVYGDNDLNNLLNGPAGNDPALIKFMMRVGAEVTEDMAKNTQNNNLAVSPLDAKDEIDKIMNDKNHAYHNPMHPENKNAQARMKQLFEKVYPSK